MSKVQQPHIADLADRIAAAFLDFLFLLPISLCLARAIPAVGDSAVFLAWAAYFIISWHKFGASPGLILMGWRVVDQETLKAPALAISVLRFFFGLVSWLPLGLGMLWMLWSKNNQAWHDRVARTIVVADDDFIEIEPDESHKSLAQLIQESTQA